MSEMFNVLFIAGIINMLTNNKSAKLSAAELFKMNQLLFFLSSWTDGRPLALQFTRWISPCQGCPRKMKAKMPVD